jgi:DNA repair protein RecN (Recombination protein N)
MLKTLYISNYALIDKLDISFEKGFSAISGETGAGKSILIGALALILGKRADSTMLFDDNKKCVVEGVFDISDLDLIKFFDVNELDYDDVSILRREILPTGKSRAFINDTPVNLNILRELGSSLVDVHSQHETLELSNSVFQLDVIDKFGTKDGLIEEYSKTFINYKSDLKLLGKLKEQNLKAKSDEDYFKFQLNELDTINIDEDEFEDLVNREKYLSHAEEVNLIVEKSSQYIWGNDDSIIDKISEITEDFSRISDLHKQFDEIHGRLHSLIVELKDIAGEIDSFSHDGDDDSGNLQQINELLNKIYGLQQKHNVNSVSQLLSLRNEFSMKLKNISRLEDQIGDLDKSLKIQSASLKTMAEKLSSIRRKSAMAFAESIRRQLSKLGMHEAEFSVSFTPLKEFNIKGFDKIDFLFTANRGSKMAEIGKIASGGELSRLMLAVKSLISSRKLLPTIIFDEIDNGVSGDVAAKVGNMLRQMSENHQLITITHLPQIAAKANSHYFVYKEKGNNRTTSNICLLNKDERIEEIAKMLSDENVSNAARETAMALIG